MHTRILILMLLTTLTARAQLCVDSSMINPLHDCSTEKDFFPVCGCDNKTYRNTCEAKNRYGVQRWTDGSCSGFEIDIYPNYSATTINFTMVQTTSPSFIRMLIVDAYGKVQVTQNITITDRYYSSIDVSQLLQGVYFLFVYDSKDHLRYRKFVRIYG